MKGKVIKYDENNINTDLIIPARFLNTSDPRFLRTHCLEDLDVDFVNKLHENEYSILVAGSNFGCGSSREQAPIALKAAGIKCVIAPSFARIFYRNAINIGLLIAEFNEVEKFQSGDDLELDLKGGFIKVLNRHVIHKIPAFPGFIENIINANGLVEYAKMRLKKGV